MILFYLTGNCILQKSTCTNELGQSIQELSLLPVYKARRIVTVVFLHACENPKTGF